MITFREELTAIKGSIDKWELVSQGKAKGPSAANCPLCELYNLGTNEPCKGCPIARKTGSPYCEGTPYVDYTRAPKMANRKIAIKFRDWLKDLYIEVSEAGDSEKKLLGELDRINE